MADEEVSYQGPDRDALIAVACKAVAVLSNKDPERVHPDEDGDVYITDGSGLASWCHPRQIPQLLYSDQDYWKA